MCILRKPEDKEQQISSVFADIRADEIPDVPFQNFLYRGKKAEEELAIAKQSDVPEEVETLP